MNVVADDITGLLKRSEAGDSQASERLLQRIYGDLRQIARARLRGGHGDTLGTTALVHEAWLAMARCEQASFDSRQHYFAYAAKAMRHILIDRARHRGADKRQPPPADFPEHPHETSFELVALDQALQRLGDLSQRLLRVAELHLFAGLSNREISQILGLTERTIERDWLKARALLAQWLEPSR